MEEEKTHGSEKCGSRANNGLHGGGKCGLYVFVVHVMEANVVYVNHKKHMVDPFVVHVFFGVHMNHVCLHHMKTCTSHEPRKCGLCGRCGSCVFEGYLIKHVKTIPHGGRENAWVRKMWFM